MTCTLGRQNQTLEYRNMTLVYKWSDPSEHAGLMQSHITSFTASFSKISQSSLVLFKDQFQGKPSIWQSGTIYKYRSHEATSPLPKSQILRMQEMGRGELA